MSVDDHQESPNIQEDLYADIRSSYGGGASESGSGPTVKSSASGSSSSRDPELPREFAALLEEFSSDVVNDGRESSATS